MSKKLISALLLGCFSFLSFSQIVVINEVCTSPKQDWSTNNFNGVIGANPVTDNDEWIELYILTDGLSLSDWTLELNDGTDVACKLTTAGSSKFADIAYFSQTGGSINDTKSGDYVVLGNPTGTMNNSITLNLKDQNNVLIDAVILGGIGNAPSGASDDYTNEVVCRLNNGKDSNIDANDFYQTIASLGRTNSTNGKIIINEVVTSPLQDFDGNGTISDATDEYIELYISTEGMNLTGYTLDIIDGSGDIFKGKISTGGIFSNSNYISSNAGNYFSTKAGDYYYLLNPDGTMNNDVKLVLYDASGNKMDSLTLNANGYPAGNSSELGDESVSRIPNGQDTDLAVDFSQALATPGAENTVYTLANFPPRAGSGYCLEFNGINQSVNLRKPIALNLTSNFTIEQWIFPTADNGAFSFKGHYSSPTANSGWTASVEGNKIIWSLRNNAEVIVSTPTSSIELNKWQHVALIMDTNTAFIYVNGVLQASAQASIRDNLNYDFQIGRRAFSPIDKHFTGKIDELRIWNKALSELEIRENMCQKISISNPIYSSLLSYYTFDSGLGNTLFDFKSVNYGVLGNSPNWTLSGAPIGKESVFLYPEMANWENQIIGLNTSNSLYAEINNVSNSPNGLHLYWEDKIPNSISGLIKPSSESDTYFGVFSVKSFNSDTIPSFNFELNYALNPNLSSANNKILCVERNANDFLTWSNLTFTLESMNDSLRIENLSDSKEIYIYKSDTNNFTTSSGELNNAENWFFGLPYPDEICEISASHSMLLTDDFTCSGLILGNNSSLDIQTNTLEINDSTIVLNSSSIIQAKNGTIIYSKNGNQSLSGLEYGNLIIDGSGNKYFYSKASACKSVRINSTNLNLDLSDFTFLSSITETASLAEIPVGSTISGDATVERFVDANTRTWYHLSSPINGAKVSDWIDDFPVTGNFIGASQIGSTKSPSIYWYDETPIDASSELGWVAFPTSNLNETIEKGRGYRVFLRENSTLPLGDTLIELSGQVNYGEIDFPISYSSIGVQDAAAAGWNFVGNPYPSAIDWDSPHWDKFNIENAIYVWDASSTPKYASYVDGISVNGGSNLIASGQGFWVKANAPNPVLKINEGAKSNQNRTLMREQINKDLNYLTISLLDSSQEISTVLRYTKDASEDFDSEKDARFFSGSSLVISTYDKKENFYSINSRPYPSSEKEVPLFIFHPEEKKKCQLKFDFTGKIESEINLLLEDKFLKTFVEIKDSLVYEFEYTNNLNSKGKHRFSILERPLSPNGLIKEDKSQSFSLFPNPISVQSEFIYLQSHFENKTDILSAGIYNCLGEKFEITAIKMEEGITKIPIYNLSTGIYLLEIIDSKNDRYNQKIQIIE